MNSPILTKRLLAVSELVRNGAFVADIGTDHAYLPISLVLEGKAVGAVASDVNEGPYLRALGNIRSHGLASKITALHTAGLCGIEKYKPTDILICGMGGELIASIINDAPWTKNERIRLVLQPMTHPEILREYLLKNGFSITDERLAKEEKIYQVIATEYTGRNGKYTKAELLLGRHNIQNRHPLLRELVSRHIEVAKKIYNAKLSGTSHADVTEEKILIEMLEEFINDGK